MRLLVFSAIICYAAAAAVHDCHMSNMESCGSPLNDFRKEMGQSFPVNEDQVNDLCKKMDEAYKCADQFKSKCMTPMQLQTMTFLTEGSMNAYNDFCKEGSATRSDYLQHAQCVDENSKTDEAKEHYSYIEAALENISEIPADKQMSTACCGFHFLTDKFNENARAKCGDEAVVAFEKVVEMVVSNLPSVLCSGFQSTSPICTKALPPPGTKPKGTIKNSPIMQSFASMYGF